MLQFVTKEHAGVWYAGYYHKRMHCSDMFTPMAEYSNKEQAERAAADFNREAKQRDMATRAQVTMLNTPWESRRLAHGFYEED